MKRKIIYPLFFGIVLILMAIFSIISIGQINPLKIVSADKILHCMAYFALFVLSIQAVNQFPGKRFYRLRYRINFVFCWCFGMGMELVQLYFTGGRREFDKYDMLANSIGIILGIAFAMILEKYWVQMKRLLNFIVKF